MSTTILESLRILYIDHLAVTTHDLMGTMDAYLRLPGSRLVRGPGDNPTQGVEYAFLRLAEGLTLEILAPRGDSESPIASHVARGAGPYHFCYAVKALDASINDALEQGVRLIVEPVKDVAFDGRRVAFLYHPLTGLFELVEAEPRLATVAPIAPSRPPESRPTVHSVSATSGLDPHQLGRRLEAVFRNAFPNAPSSEIPSLGYGSIPEWTSLGHLMLIMEVEREFAISVAAHAVAHLDSFAAILKYLEENL